MFAEIANFLMFLNTAQLFDLGIITLSQWPEIQMDGMTSYIRHINMRDNWWRHCKYKRALDPLHAFNRVISLIDHVKTYQYMEQLSMFGLHNYVRIIYSACVNVYT
jgi:hypothetical protein